MLPVSIGTAVIWALLLLCSTSNVVAVSSGGRNTMFVATNAASSEALGSVTFCSRDDFPHESDRIRLESLAGISRRQLGLQGQTASDVPRRLVDSRLLKRDIASLTIAVEGINSDVVVSYHLNNIKKIISEHPSLLLEDVYRPRSMVSMMTSAVTGSSPFHHGIVSTSWKSPDGSRVEAFSSDPDASSRVANTADILEQAFPGEPLTIGISSSAPLCATVSSQSLYSRSFSIVLDQEAMREAPSSDLRVTPDEMLKLIRLMIPKLPLGASAISSVKLVDSNQIQVNVDGESTNLMLDNPAVFALLAELVYATELTSKLEASSSLRRAVHDDVPDSFSVIVVGAERVREAFGDESAQYRAVLMLVDAAIPKIVSSISSLYNERVDTQLLLLPRSDVSYLNSDAKASLLRVNNRLDLSHLPLVYLPRSASDAEFKSLSSGLRSHAPKLNLLSLQAPSIASVSQSDIDEYQICLWFSIVSIFVLLWSLYAFAYMENTRDTLLYTQFPPTASKKMR